MKQPQQHLFDTIWGHEAARRFVPRLLSQGRLPHAILLTGPDSIGKRSLAFAMAKAILSAGVAARQSSISAAGGLAFAKRTVGADGGEDDDLFGGGGEDLFAAAQEDLFGEAEAEPDLFAALESEATEPAPPPTSVAAPMADAPRGENTTRPKAGSPARKAVSLLEAVDFVGFDDRVCRLVEASYPVEYDSNNRPTNRAHCDFNIVEPIGGRRSILVEQIRSFHEAASIPPVEGAFRVVIVLGADTITQEAGNSILKLLEEPPGYLVLILVANQLSRVLPTIKSRCAVVPMAPLGRGELAEKLVEQEGLARDLARTAAALSEGRPGVALNVVSGDLLKRRRDVFEARLQLDRYGLCALPGAASRIQAAGKLDETLWLLLSFARDRLVSTLAPDRTELLVHGDIPDTVATKAPAALLDEEAERLIAAWSALDHPYVPNIRAVIEEALWLEGAM